MATTSKQLIPVNGAAPNPYVFECVIPTPQNPVDPTTSYRHNNLRSPIPGARYGRDDRNGVKRPNIQALIFDNDPRPSALGTSFVRRTVAVDVKFNAAYLDNSHFVLWAGHSGDPYIGLGSNRCGSLILGAFNGNTRSACLEEIEVAPLPDHVPPLPYGGNAFQYGKANCLTPDVWYRAAFDLVFVGGEVKLYGRVWNKGTGAMVYQPSSYDLVPSVNSGAYHASSDNVGFFDLNYAGKAEVKNMVSYWGLASDFVVSP